MPKATCIQRLRDGLQSRYHSPLHHGCYKLCEVIPDLSTIPAEFDRIKAVRTKKASPDTLRHCTTEDAHIWIRNIPAYVAHSLGRNVLLGLLASVREGAPPDPVCKAYIDLSQRCQTLAHRMDDAQQQTARNTLHACELLKPLIEEAVHVARQALTVADPQGRWNQITTGGS
jgi:hypothetical protein